MEPIGSSEISVRNNQYEQNNTLLETRFQVFKDSQFFSYENWYLRINYKHSLMHTVYNLFIINQYRTIYFEYCN